MLQAYRSKLLTGTMFHNSSQNRFRLVICSDFFCWIGFLFSDHVHRTTLYNGLAVADRTQIRQAAEETSVRKAFVYKDSNMAAFALTFHGEKHYGDGFGVPVAWRIRRVRCALYLNISIFCDFFYLIYKYLTFFVMRIYYAADRKFDERKLLLPNYEQKVFPQLPFGLFRSVCVCSSTIFFLSLQQLYFRSDTVLRYP